MCKIELRMCKKKKHSEVVADKLVSVTVEEYDLSEKA